ncbi:MAG: hypothetical protein ACLPT6_10780 [Desulfobaccales bacterium]
MIPAMDEECDTAELIRKAKCGLVAPPAQEEALAEAVLYYYRHPEALELAGHNGRRFFLKHFEKELVLKQYVDLVDAVACGGGGKTLINNQMNTSP